MSEGLDAVVELGIEPDDGAEAAAAPPAERPRPRERIMVLTDGLGATQEISFAQPLARLVEAGEIELRLERLVKVGMPEVITAFDPTIVVFSRSAYPGGTKLVNFLRRLDIPVIVHLDDDLLDVPMTLGLLKWEFHHKPHRLKALNEALDASAVVYVSTPTLGDVMEAHGVTSPIVRGQIYCSIDPAQIRPDYPSTVPVIGYMGTQGHTRDLAIVLPAIERLMDETPALRFETFGSIEPPAALARFGARVGHHGIETNYDAFFDKLCDLGWWIGLAPIEDVKFNLCKADTKWVEYTTAGIAVVASDLSVYRPACSDGAGVLADDDGWYDALSALLRDGERRKAMIGAARRKLTTTYSRQSLETQVMDVFAQAHRLHKDKKARRGKEAGTAKTS